MEKCFVLAVCLIQQVILIAQTEKSLQHAESVALEATQIMDTSQKVPVKRLYEAYNATLHHQTKYRARSLNWIEMGPQDNVSGRVRSLLILPNTRKAFAGGITGGLWVTDDIDAGIWRPVNDFFFNLNVSCIAIDPSDPTRNTLYFGTGENMQPASLVNNATEIRGQGIWKSIDGGTTWKQLPSTVNGTALNDFNIVRKILVDRNGNIFASNRKGIYKSSDKGNNWGPSLLITAEGNDLDMSSDGTIYATVYPTDYTSTRLGKIFKLVGTDWIELIPNTHSFEVFKRCEIACSPSNDQIIYALVENLLPSLGRIRLYRSNNKGATWTQVNTTSVTGIDQPFNALSIAIDPNDPNVVFLGGTNMYRCRNVIGSDVIWTPISNTESINKIHVDQHQIIFAQGSSAKCYIATDGGIFTTDDIQAGIPTFTSISKNLRICQFTTVSATANNTIIALAGAQDNQTQQFKQGYLANSTTVAGGDGMYCFISPLNPLHQIASQQNGLYWRSKDGVNFNLTKIFGVYDKRGSFKNPTDWSVIENTVYMFSDGSKYANGITEIYRWDDVFGVHKEPITFPGAARFLSGKRISFIKVSPNNPNTVYIGLSDESSTPTPTQLIRMTNACTTAPNFEDITGNLNTTAYISSIAINHTGTVEDNELVLTFSNYGIQNIWYTSSANTSSPSWVALDQNCTPTTDGCLPDMPVRYALFVPNWVDATRNVNNYRIIIATETGIWATKALAGEATKWYPINGGKLPNVRTDMIILRKSDGMLFAATYGRGLWRSDMFAFNQVDFTATVTKPRIGSCMLNLTGIAAEPATVSSWNWTVKDGTASPRVLWEQTASIPYCGNPITEILLRINNGIGGNYVIVMKRLNEITIIPAGCPVCTDRSKETHEEEAALSVDPNPNQGRFMIRLAGTETIETIEIYTVTGQLIQTVQSPTEEINIEKEPAGVYICQVKTNKGQLLTSKIVKQ